MALRLMRFDYTLHSFMIWRNFLEPFHVAVLLINFSRNDLISLLQSRPGQRACCISTYNTIVTYCSGHCVTSKFLNAEVGKQILPVHMDLLIARIYRKPGASHMAEKSHGPG